MAVAVTQSVGNRKITLSAADLGLVLPLAYGAAAAVLFTTPALASFFPANFQPKFCEMVVQFTPAGIDTYSIRYKKVLAGITSGDKATTGGFVSAAATPSEIWLAFSPTSSATGSGAAIGGTAATPAGFGSLFFPISDAVFLFQKTTGVAGGTVDAVAISFSE